MLARLKQQRLLSSKRTADIGATSIAPSVALGLTSAVGTADAGRGSATTRPAESAHSSVAVEERPARGIVFGLVIALIGFWGPVALGVTYLLRR